MKTETWNGHSIRFVEVNSEWWAVAKDVAEALNFRDANVATRKLRSDYKATHKVRTPSGEQEMLILNEKGLYRLIMRSNKPEAEAFQDWVYDIIKTLRQASGLEGFQIFRMLDKEHQREAMKRLHDGLEKSAPVNYIKANTIANKTVSILHGYPKMVKKNDMPKEWLPERQQVLDDTVDLMTTNEKFKLNISVSEMVRRKYGIA